MPKSSTHPSLYLSVSYLFLLGAFVYLFASFIHVLVLAFLTAGIFLLPSKFLQSKCGKYKGTFLMLIGIFLLTVLPITLLSGLLVVESIGFLKFIQSLDLNMQQYQFHFLHWQFDTTQIINSISANLKTITNSASSALLSLSQLISDFSFKFVLFWYFLFYFILDFQMVLNTIAKYLPFKNSLSTELVSNIQENLSQILKGSLLLSLLTFITTLIFLTFIGVKSKLILALIVAILSLIPSIGSILGLALIAPFVYLSSGALACIYLLIYLILIDQLLINIFLRGKIVEDHLQIHPLMIFLAFFCGVIAFGNMGVFYGPLILIGLKVLRPHLN